MKIKHVPVWLIIIADILILAIGLCTFAYFHHIRILWAPFKMVEPSPLQLFEKPEDVGDFSETLGAFFSSDKYFFCIYPSNRMRSGLQHP